MSLLSDAEVAEGRALALANLPDTCKIERVTPGSGVFNETTLQYGTAESRTLIYQGPCKFQIRADINANIVEPQELDREWAYQTSTLLVPIAGTENVRVDDVATVLTAKYDTALVGREFNVHADQHKSLASVRRLRVRESVR